MRKNVLGVGFATVWATAAIATKFGIRSSDPLMLAIIRFLVTAFLLAVFCYLLNGKRKGYRLPGKGEWRPLLFIGLFNTSLYLGAFFLALKYVSAGLTGLFIATNPLLISLLSFLFLKRKISRLEVVGMAVAAAGLVFSTLPALQNGEAQPLGIALLLFSMVAYSVSGVYFSKVTLQLPAVVVNLWQLLFGGLLLLPLALLMGNYHVYQVDGNFLGALVWLILPVSILANQLWFYLLKADPVGAGNFLFLTPVFNYLWSYLLLGEQLTLYSVVGGLVVIVGLFLTKWKPALQT